SFRTAIKKDWKGDGSSRGLAGANLGMLAANEGRRLSAKADAKGAAQAFAESAAGYGIAADTFPAHPQHRMNQAKMLWASGDKTGGCQSAALLDGKMDAAQYLSLRSQMGCR